MHQRATKPNRIVPDRKWFGNVRTTDAKSLEKFRIEMALRSNSAHNVLIKNKKLPLSLIVDPVKENKMNILDIESFKVK